MTYEAILYDVADGIATVTLNRPDKLNAWTRAMQAEVQHAMHRAAADDAVRAIVLTGAGRGFCAGADMGLLSDIQEKGAERVSAEPAASAVPPQGSTLPDFEPREGFTGETLARLLRWDEAEFLRRTEGSAIRRIGHERWLRNVAVAAGNALRVADDVGLRAALQDRLSHPGALVREHAAWALAQHH